MCYGKYVLQTSALTLSCPQQPAVLYCDSCSGSGALQLVCDDTEGGKFAFGRTLQARYTYPFLCPM